MPTLSQEGCFYLGRRLQMNKKKIIGIAAFILLTAALVVAYIAFRPSASAGEKSITIEVVNSSQETKSYDVDTDAEFLRQAMEETDGLEFSGSESEYGMMISTVNGETADYEKDGAYWSIMVNGEYGNYGIDQQPVVDGDVYQLVYTK